MWVLQLTVKIYNFCPGVYMYLIDFRMFNFEIFWNPNP